jgi:hypothetical protein
MTNIIFIIFIISISTAEKGYRRLGQVDSRFVSSTNHTRSSLNLVNLQKTSAGFDAKGDEDSPINVVVH